MRPGGARVPGTSYELLAATAVRAHAAAAGTARRPRQCVARRAGRCRHRSPHGIAVRSRAANDGQPVRALRRRHRRGRRRHAGQSAMQRLYRRCREGLHATRTCAASTSSSTSGLRIRPASTACRCRCSWRASSATHRERSGRAAAERRYRAGCADRSPHRSRSSACWCRSCCAGTRRTTSPPLPRRATSSRITCWIR